jgi:hypothetical protein
MVFCLDYLKLIFEEQQKTNGYLKMILEQLTERIDNNGPMYSINEDPSKWIIKDSVPKNINAEIFKRSIDVYYNEELERIKSNNNRKAPRRVSVELGGALCDFLNRNLMDEGIESTRFPDGLVILKYNDRYIGAIKIITDIGFNRGEKWFEYAEGIVKHCKTKYDLENNKVFFIISSLRNGVDQGYIENLLDRDIRSNLQFLNNRKLVIEFIEKYISLTTSLAVPNKQIYILASELHPNIIADDLHKMTDEQKRETFKQVDAYEWLSDLNELLKIIKNFALSHPLNY